MTLESVSELTRIGQGRSAEIFEWEAGRVLRLYHAGSSLGWVQRELRAFQGVNEADIPSPGVYPTDSDDGLMQIEDRLGFVMDHIGGPTMLRKLTEQPWKLWPLARMSANLHAHMHGQCSQTLPSQRERFHRVIDHLAEQLTPDVIARLHHALDNLDDGNVICHGDFHPDNIILSDRGPIIIDWGPATSGAPAADIAWTVYLFKNGGYPPGMKRWQRIMVAVLRRLFLSAYLRAYFHLSSTSRRDVEDWEVVTAAIRLADGFPEERDRLRQVLHEFGENASS
ncbi:aminoglycoside phosphotransferase family protein [Candidatus Bipolaricaulota bacterium]